jgi:hypothetical protein
LVRTVLRLPEAIAEVWYRRYEILLTPCARYVRQEC